ncbi:prepilin-type N-terminal cleavage/methylation domain-containing protein [Ureibacillus xyleni]|uniref:Prepilin-type N-terminal cleavage/methylation domain-containing protein n=1 Tax=Ureibacillus xyleni TaxID=614648 RepID=A0A285RIF4_9BACL|nr:type II secretion system protein [Ureibacillus xyleni]SOB93915.1 prepilin-type N-terminal cleavage/methylation domain-containing protein [Ureibacillus xyleni]
MYKEYQNINNNGLTLIEVLASIVLIGIILLSFSPLLLQGAKGGKASEEIVNSTYEAQTAMEGIFSVSNTPQYSSVLQTEIEQDFVSLGYRKNSNASTSTKLVYELGNPSSTDSLNVEATIQRDPSGKIVSGNLVKIVLIFHEDGKTKAKLENVMAWKVAS